MTKSKSILYDLYLDLKRGLSNKRFWSVLGIFSLVFILHMVLRYIWPLTVYYYGFKGLVYEALHGPTFTPQLEIQNITSMQLFHNFFPFIGSLAYAYTIMDDKRTGYYIQQTQRVGFSRYYWCKLAASAILSGVLGALLLASICLLAVLLTTYNPFFKEATEYYSQYTDFWDNHTISWGYHNVVAAVHNPWAWWFVGGIKYFIEGVLFGLMASVIAFFSDNRVLMTAVPILYFIIEDMALYMLRCLFGIDSNVSEFLNKFTFRSEMGNFSYGNLYHYVLLIFLILLFLVLAMILQRRAKSLYMEGGNADD
ncbi:MAG: hypothetical protein NC433_11110 [Clostridiales bacterium]|nr:hypothetical protein [Clostridiales bacterium]